MKIFAKILLLISFAIIVEITMARYLLVKFNQEQALSKVEGGMMKDKGPIGNMLS